ncbi:MAG: molybdopterin-synthase adenylyltransferase MoeB [Clostridia bacterium]|nr:molybdopterin-synthase adenylyltransferase MoeB [Clostridia bacterium]
MQIPIYISATLRTFTNRKAEIVVEGTTIREALQRLQDEYPDSKNALFEENGRLRPFVSVFVNDVGISEESAWDTALEATDRILLLPVIAGGAPTESVISDERRKEISLDDAEIERFNKHLMLRDIGVKGQKRIKAAKVLIIGLGALGSPVVQYLAAAGVGTIGLADFDEVSLGNLQSQVIHGTRDVHRPKTASAKDTVRAINPKIRVETVNEKLEASRIADVIEAYDIVVDCTDNYKSRYLINDACVLQGKPVVFGAMYQFEGQVSVFDAKSGPCFRCQFPSPPPAGLVPTCAEGGVISPLPGIIGSMQANEVLKLIVGGGESLIGKLLVADTWNLHTSVLKIHKNAHCPICGKEPTITEIEDFDYEDFCGLKPQEDEIPVDVIEAEELVARIEKGDPITIVDVREPHERAIHRFAGAIVIPIGQLSRRQKELDPEVDTVFICKEGKRSILAINTLREAGYKGPMYSLKGGIESAKNIIFSHEGAWL